MLPSPKDRFLTDKKILIGIGTKTVRDIVIGFCRDKGANEIMFGTGEEALQHLENFTPNFVFAEYAMEPLDGLKFCHTLRQSLTAPIPMVMLLSSRDNDGHARSRKVGATETLMMPFSLGAITATTKKALEHGNIATPSGLRFGPRPG